MSGGISHTRDYRKLVCKYDKATACPTHDSVYEVSFRSTHSQRPPI